MKKNLKTICLLLAGAIISLITGLASASAAAEGLELTVLADLNPSLQYSVKDYQKEDQIYIFLPSETNVADLKISYSGNVEQTIGAELSAEDQTITKDFSVDKDFQAVLADDSVLNVTVLKSTLPSICISLNDADPTKNSLDYLHASKDNVVGANLQLYDNSNDTNDLADKGIEIKCRGNSTFTFEKKPYQIKFSSKTAVLGMPSAKTWILLANHADASFLRNKAAIDLASEFGMEYSSESAFADVFLEGEYQGSYQVIEKVQTGTNRVELADPEGVLLELDNVFFYEEDYYFSSWFSNTSFTLKDSVSGNDTASAQAGWQDAQDTINQLESLLYAEDPDWERISAIIDVESFIKYYFIQELSANKDAGKTSTYLYKDGASDLLHVGPAWDYDCALGNMLSDSNGGNPTLDFIKNLETLNKGPEKVNDWYTQLFRNEEFASLVHEMYTSSLRDKILEVPDKIDVQAEALDASNSPTMNFTRWNILGTQAVLGEQAHTIAATYLGETDYLKDWVNQRIAYLEGAYGAEHPILQYSFFEGSAGWQPAVTTGVATGSEGAGLRMEALKADVLNTGLSGDLECNAYLQALGWRGWTDAAGIAGSPEWNLSMEAVQLKLTGELAERYDLYYRVCSQDYGWLGWARNGETAGTIGKDLGISGIQINLVAKGTLIRSLGEAAVVEAVDKSVRTDLAEGYYKLQNDFGLNYLNLSGASQADGAEAIFYPYEDSANSTVYLESNEDGSYCLQFLHSGKLLDEDAANARLIQWSGNGGDNQRWYVYADEAGNLYLRNKQTFRWLGAAEPSVPVLTAGMATGDSRYIFHFQIADLQTELPTAAEIPDGAYTIRSKNSSLVMDVYGGGVLEGTNIIQWPDHGKANQQWIFEKLENGWYKITSALNPAYCLDVYGGGSAIGNRVIQWSYQGRSNQQWLPIANDDGTISLMSRLAYENGTGFLLDVYGGGLDQGVDVIQWTGHYGDNQKWILEPVPAYAISYESNGGSPVAPSSARRDGLLAEPADPVRNGLVFGGWCKDEALTIPWNFATDRMPAEELVLYAKWLKDYSGSYTIRSKNSSLVMDVYGGGLEQGTNIIQWRFNDGDNQKWTLESLGRGYYKISSVLNPRFSLDVYGGGSEVGNRVIQWPWHGGTNQQWKLLANDDGTVSFRSRLAEENATNFLLDVYGGGLDEGVNVIQWTAHFGDNQKWYLIPADQ